MKTTVAAFRGMHVSPAKNSYAWLPVENVTTEQTHTQTDRQTARKSDPYVSLCFAGDTIKTFPVFFLVYSLPKHNVFPQNNIKDNLYIIITSFRLHIFPPKTSVRSYWYPETVNGGLRLWQPPYPCSLDFIWAIKSIFQIYPCYGGCAGMHVQI